MAYNSLLHYRVNQRELKLSTNMQLLVENRLNNDKKNEVAEWLLWIFLGRFGFHRFYMKRPYGLGLFLLNIFGWILTCTIFLAFIGIPLICATWIWWLIDGFYIHNWIVYSNDIKKNKIINDITHTTISVQSLEHFAQPLTTKLTPTHNNNFNSKNNINNQPKGKHFFHKSI